MNDINPRLPRRRTLRNVDTVHRLGLKPYVAASGAAYPDGSFGVALQSIAQLLRTGVSMRVATVDLGGWDTHQYQGDDGQGYLAELLGTLAQGLSAFYHDMVSAGLADRVTIVTMSEFGRRLVQNASGGTDHGHGSAMLILGGSRIAGGRVFGRWPGLRNDVLYDRADLAVTTDYRQVLSELIAPTIDAAALTNVFPKFAPGSPLGILRAA